MQQDEWSDEEFERFTNRMTLFKENPKSLSTEVYEKCKALHAEIERDSNEVKQLLSAEKPDIRSLRSENSTRAQLVEWLAKTP